MANRDSVLKSPLKWQDYTNVCGSGQCERGGCDECMEAEEEGQGLRDRSEFLRMKEFTSG